jgi:hypothetical protein
MKHFNFVLLVLFGSLSLAACGTVGETVGIGIDDAYCPAGRQTLDILPEELRIETYRVTISAPDISPPITFDFEGKTTSAPLQNIPKGKNRTLTVEAVNSGGQIICRRTINDLTIEGGKLSSVAVPLLAVPFATNLSNGNLITQSRLVFRGYGEPGGAIEILDQFGGNETVLNDLNTNSDLIQPSINDAGFFFRPSLLPLGTHTFVVRDGTTGESNQVTVTLVRPGREPGRGIQTTGSVAPFGAQTAGRIDLLPDVMEQVAQ